MAYRPTITERKTRLFSGLLDESTIQFSPEDNATTVDAWKHVQPSVAEFALDTVAGSLERTIVDVDGNIKTVETPYASDKKRLLLKRENGTWTPKELVSHNWKLPNVAACVSALKEFPFPVVRARAINGGELIGFTFDIGSGNIGGETVQRFVNAIISNKPDVAHSFYTSASNLFCINAFFMHFAMADIGFRVGHGAQNEMEQYFAFLIDLRSRVAGYGDQVHEFLESMAERFVSKLETDSIFRAAFPDPKKPTSIRISEDKFGDALKAIREEGNHSPVLATLEGSTLKYVQDFDRQVILRELCEDALQRYEWIDKRPAPGTAYAAYQAVTEVSSHRTGRGNIGDSVFNGGRRREIERASARIAVMVDA